MGVHVFGNEGFEAWWYSEIRPGANFANLLIIDSGSYHIWHSADGLISRVEFIPRRCSKLNLKVVISMLQLAHYADVW